MIESARPGRRRCRECARFLKASALGDLCPKCEALQASQLAAAFDPPLTAVDLPPPAADPPPPAADLPPPAASPPPLPPVLTVRSAPARLDPLAGVPNVDVGVVIPRPSELHPSLRSHGLTTLRGPVEPLRKPADPAPARRRHTQRAMPVIPLSVQILIGVVIGAVIAVAVPLLLSR